MVILLIAPVHLCDGMAPDAAKWVHSRGALTGSPGKRPEVAIHAKDGLRRPWTHRLNRMNRVGHQHRGQHDPDDRVAARLNVAREDEAFELRGDIPDFAVADGHPLVTFETLGKFFAEHPPSSRRGKQLASSRVRRARGCLPKTIKPTRRFRF